MRAFDSSALATLDAGRIATRGLLRFDLGSGSYGFWNGLGNIVYQSLTYVGAGRLISIDKIDATLDFSISPIVVRLSSVPESALTPDVLATIYAEDWHQKPAILSRAYFNPDTRALLSVERVSRRVIDRIEDESTVGGAAMLVAYLEPVTFDNPKRGFARFGDADQRLIDASDGFFAFAATAGSEQILWGRDPASSSAAAAGVAPRPGGPGQG